MEDVFSISSTELILVWLVFPIIPEKQQDEFFSPAYCSIADLTAVLCLEVSIPYDDLATFREQVFYSTAIGSSTLKVTPWSSI